jgi:hypothetical protein
MLPLATTLLGIVLLLGSFLAILHMRAKDPPSLCAWLGPVHGTIAIGGLGLLLAGLGGPPHGYATGTESFRTIAAVILAIAAFVGVVILVARLRRWRGRGALIGVHGTIAIAGFVVLLVYMLLA